VTIVVKRLIVSAKANADLQGIFKYIAKDRPSAAAAVVKHISKRMEIIHQHPHIGESVDDILVGMRRYTAGSYVIYFRENQTQIQVVRILHGAMDPTSFFWSEP
jgi:toxin ParE1/3/4